MLKKSITSSFFNGITFHLALRRRTFQKINVESLKLKFQTVAEKIAKNFRGYFILPHLVDTYASLTKTDWMWVLFYDSLILCLFTVRLLLRGYWMIIVDVVSDVLLRCLESLERKASDSSDQQETSAALKEVKRLWNSTHSTLVNSSLCCKIIWDKET